MNQIATDAADPGHVSAELLRCNLDALGGKADMASTGGIGWS